MNIWKHFFLLGKSQFFVRSQCVWNFYNKIISLEHIFSIKEKFQCRSEGWNEELVAVQRVPVNGRKKHIQENFKIPKCRGILLPQYIPSRQHNKCFNISQNSSVFDRTAIFGWWCVPLWTENWQLCSKKITRTIN